MVFKPDSVSFCIVERSLTKNCNSIHTLHYCGKAPSPCSLLASSPFSPLSLPLIAAGKQLPSLPCCRTTLIVCLQVASSHLPSLPCCRRAHLLSLPCCRRAPLPSLPCCSPYSPPASSLSLPLPSLPCWRSSRFIIYYCSSRFQIYFLFYP